MNALKSATCMVLTASFSSTPLLSVNVLSLEDALRKGLIQIIIKGKGGYTGDVIEMKIKNISNQNLDFKVETGRRLDSKTDDQQDILVTQPQEFFVNARQQKIINVFGMCCQAHNSAPTEKSFYSVGKIADSNLVKLASFIDKNKYYTNYTAQQAVWVVSDDNSIGSITDGDKEMVNSLRNYVSKITGKIIPTYDVTYRQQNEYDLLGKATKIDGVFNYSLPANSHVSIAIYDVHGNLVQLLFENISHQKGDYKLHYTFRTLHVPEGIYYARMNLDGAVKKEEKIEF